MIGKKINQLATELAPVSTDLTIIGDPISGVSKKITLAQLGAIFSGAVSFYTNLAGFPATGDINVIYCAKDTQKLYLWSGSAYVEVFPSQALLDTYQLRSEKGVSNGYASLDSAGKVPISQLPSSIMEYKGTWNAATNTPTLANGTGDTGDVYICNVAGTVDFGAGPITFAVGDYVIYSGSIWQRSSGAVGTVTSVAATITGDAIGITGSPVTTSGTLAFAFAGTGAQYIKGDGTLATFPSTIAQAERLITEVYNSTGATLTKGTIVYINGGQGNLPTVTKALATGDSTSAQTFGVVQADITNNNNGYVVVAGKLNDLDTQAYTEGTQLYLSSTTAGAWTSTKQYAPAHLVYVGIVVRSHPTQGIVEIKIQNGYELDEIHNVAAQTPTNNDGLFWESATSLWKNKSIATILGGTPITGSGNVNAIPKFTANSVLGNSVMEDDGNFVSMRGLKLNASAGVGNTINFQQGTGITAGGLGYSTIGASSTTGFIFYIDQNTTSRNFILDTSTITSDAQRTYSMPDTSGTLALVSQLTGGTVTSVGLSSATSGVTIGSTPITTSGTITLAIATASGSQQGLLSSTDWTTFNNKQDALTNPVTGTGTTNYLPKFTGTSTIGNSIVQDDGSTLTIGGALSGRNATFTSSTANIGIIGTGTFSYLQLGHNGGATKYSYLVATSDGVLDIEANIVKFTDYSGASERMRINASGELLVGVTSLATGFSTFAQFEVSGSTGGILINSATNNIGRLMFTNNNASGGEGLIRYDGSNKSMQFWTNASEGMRLSSSGNLSIGNTNDSFRLEVTGEGRFYQSATSSTAYLRVENNRSRNAALRLTTTVGDYYLGVGIGADVNQFQIYDGNAGATRLTIASTGAATFSSSVTATQFIVGSATTSSDVSVRYKTDTGDFSTINDRGSHAFGIYDHQVSSYRMYINTSGNVGIGTTSPGRTLHVLGQTGIGTVLKLEGAAGSTTYLQLAYNGATNVQSGYIGYDSSANMPFFTNDTERMRITSGGNVLVGTTSLPSASVSGFCITGTSSGNISSSGASTSAYNHLLFYNGNGLVGYISTSGSTTTYSTSSDYRLKTDLKDFSGLDLVSKIKAYDYEWKSDKSRSYGVIAHELQSVINYAVTGVKDGEQMQGVDYSKIVPVLIKAIQELNDKIK